MVKKKDNTVKVLIKNNAKITDLITNNCRGIALVIVMWILALLSTIAAELAFSMKTELNIVRNFKAATQAHYIAQAGLNQTIVTLMRQKRRLPVDADAPIAAPQALRINALNPPQSFAGGQFMIRLDNTRGKININNAGPALLEILLNGLGIDERDKAIIIDSILDWRDDDDFHRLNGAENDFYRTLETPYACKNGDFSAKAELRWVRGVTPEIYKRLAPMVVVIPNQGIAFFDEDFQESDEDDNDGPLDVQININAAPLELLAGLPGLDLTDIEQIRQYRSKADFLSLNDVEALLGADIRDAIEPFITLALSSYYIIRAEGRMATSPARQTIEALVHFDTLLDGGYRIVRMEESLF